jgi:hypothetical protein
LQASARIERKIAVQEKPPEPERRPLVVLDTEPAGHWVDGELVLR